MTGHLFKGFPHADLTKRFGVTFEDGWALVPHFNRDGSLYCRQKMPLSPGRPRFLWPDGLPTFPYGLETLRYGGNTVFLTEGQSCAWALRAEFPRTPVVGIPGAQTWKDEYADYFAPFPVIYLSFDQNEAGTSLLERVWPQLGWARRVKLPAGKDTRDVLRICRGVPLGGEDYERMLNDADRIAGVTRRIFEVAAPPLKTQPMIGVAA